MSSRKREKDAEETGGMGGLVVNGSRTQTLRTHFSATRLAGSLLIGLLFAACIAWIWQVLAPTGPARAAYKGDLPTLSRYLAASVDPNQRQYNWLSNHPAPLSVLDWAVMGDQPESIRLLMNSGAMTSESITTSLLLAIHLRQLSSVEVLLAAGADPYATDINGNSILWHAFGTRDISIASLVLEHLDVERDSMFPGVIGGAFSHFAEKDTLQLMAIMLNNNMSPDIRFGSSTLLMLSARNGRSDLVDLLLAFGADVSLVDTNGRTVHDYVEQCQGDGCDAVRQVLIWDNE